MTCTPKTQMNTAEPLQFRFLGKCETCNDLVVQSADKCKMGLKIVKELEMMVKSGIIH